MKILVTGSAGHLGEALVRTLQNTHHDVIGMDLIKTDFTHTVGSICDRDRVRQCLKGVDAVLHTATLHKPHVSTHSRQSFVDTNITGTLNLLEEAVATQAQVVQRRFPDYEEEYWCCGWKMFPGIERVYVNEKYQVTAT